MMKMMGKGSSRIDLEALLEGCIANILSFTIPMDACRLTLVSKTSHSVAQFDAVWDRFLPSNLNSIISQSSLLASFSSKKALYLTLSNHPIIIDHGQKSFQFHRRSGKKCYMLAARDLSIFWGDTSQYWNWTTLSDSRFQEVAELVAVCWFEICGRINTLELSPDTWYAAFLVFKMIHARGFRYCPVLLSVGIFGGHSQTKIACLDPNFEEEQGQLDGNSHGLRRPNVRSDGWLEIEMGEFFNSGLEYEEVEISVRETKTNLWKHGFLLEGIEHRPKMSHRAREAMGNGDGHNRPGRILRNLGDKF